MFKISSNFKPTGDQPNAINSLLQGLDNNLNYQCLEGVTGSGKTFTIANVINNYNKPTLILCHNKTLAAQLYEEFKHFFPHNLIEYFVSYYDYYQPEAYIPVTNTYIEKDLSINEEIEKYRISTTSSLLSGRKDVIVIASVSCIYGLGNPKFFQEKKIPIKQNTQYERKNLLFDLIDAQYKRTHDSKIKKGEFKIVGDMILIQPSHIDNQYRIHFWGDEIDKIEIMNSNNNNIKEVKELIINPANIFITSKKINNKAINEIKNELKQRIKYFNKNNRINESNRIQERVQYDLEMIKELGYCTGIENYSRYLDGRKKGERPFCLIDYFPNDFLMIIDESHVTIPQVKAMYGGDQSRKTNLVEYGFRLPSALDNRPLEFSELEKIINKVIFLSATPSEYELKKCNGLIIEQLIRPTGLLEPIIEIQPCKNQIDHLLGEIQLTTNNNQRVLVTTLTKRMAEDFSKYLINLRVNATYIHSDVDTIKRVAIMNNLRLGKIDVLIGVNLLREGLDLPEVSLVAIMDADKEGFLRSKKSLIQTIGRAARHINGKAILYADNITKSIHQTIKDNNRKRKIQTLYNVKNKITPQALKKKIRPKTLLINQKNNHNSISDAQPNPEILSIKELRRLKNDTIKKMNNAAKSMDFLLAAKHRDYLFKIKELLKLKK